MVASSCSSIVRAAALWVAVTLAAPAAAEPFALKPLPDAAVKAFASIAPDPKPKQLAANSHFVISDEKRHDLYREPIAGIGGLLTGVGTDQLYLMAGWARPEVLVPLDFDQVVVDLHKVYRIAFLESADPEAFFDFWRKERVDEVHALIDRYYPDPAENAALRKAYKISRGLVIGKLGATRKLAKKLKFASFLDDAEQYGWIVGLFRSNRVFPIRGDLTGTSAMRGLAEAARAAGVTVRVLSLSNAELYFDYVQSFRDNVKALPVDDRSLVLRTASLGPEWAAEVDGRYHYSVQRVQDFNVWLEDPKVKTYRAITAVRNRTKKNPGFSTVDRLPKGRAR